MAFAMAIISVLVACEEKKLSPGAEPAPAAAQPVAVAPAQPDWSTVAAASKEVAAETQFRLARLVDAWHQGGQARVSLSFAAPGQVIDENGHSAAMTSAEWKGLVELIRATPGRKSATRALPAAAHNYSDGLGRARRHAYYVSVTDDSKIVLEMVKPLDDESNG
ncbi:MAG: hypothetical protein IT436_03155 [Phycisphaerales bacterium]|nr:hypothetical protein [Phycisphaerales bacterium]